MSAGSTHEAAAPAPVATVTAKSESADDTALFAKYIAQHETEVGGELGEPSAKPNPRASNGKRQERKAADGKEPIHAAKATPEPAPAVDESAADPDAADDDDPDGGRRAPDGSEPVASGGVADDVEAARAAWAKGDKDALDAALKRILPESKGLAEFAVDGKRWSEFRTVFGKRKAAQDKRDTELQTRESNLQRGLSMIESLVSRYEPIERLVKAAEADDVDAFVALVEKATKRPLNDTVKRHLDKKLGKPVDPHLDALQRQVQQEREARLALEKQIADEKTREATTGKIRAHLGFLHERLGKSDDARVRALVASPEGMRAVFEAQKAHYDPRNNRTLTPEAAAAYVIAQKAKELEPWRNVVAPAAAPALPAAAEPAAPAAARAARPLSSRGNGASRGGRKLTDSELFEKYERMQKLG